MFNPDESPRLYGELKNAQPCALESLKGVNMAFYSYGIAIGETVVFPTAEMIAEHGSKLFKKGKAFAGARNETILVLVERIYNNRSYQDWFNLNTMRRTANDEAGNRIMIDNVRADFQGDDAFEIMNKLIGKAIKGTGELKAYGPVFDNQTRQPKRDENGHNIMQEQTYVQVDWAEPRGE